MIIYIHGFGGSGEGSKAKAFRDYFHSIGEDFIAPSLSYVPELAIGTLKELIKSYHGEVYLIGSSLGGYYATYLSQMEEVKKIVLINPATKPYETLRRALGEASNFYDGSYFQWSDKHIEMLKSYKSDSFLLHIRRDDFLVMLQKGDELLDYKDALMKYDGCQVVVEEGGSHSFEGIERHFERIRAFFAVGDHFKHTPTVKGVGLPNDVLADRIGDLYYDDLAQFLKTLSNKLSSDAKADRKRGRGKLADSLAKSAALLDKSSMAIEDAWEVCAIPTIRWMIEHGFNKEIKLSSFDNLPQDISEWYYGREITMPESILQEIKREHERMWTEHIDHMSTRGQLAAFIMGTIDELSMEYPQYKEEIEAIVVRLTKEKA